MRADHEFEDGKVVPRHTRYQASEQIKKTRNHAHEDLFDEADNNEVHDGPTKPMSEFCTQAFFAMYPSSTGHYEYNDLTGVPKQPEWDFVRCTRQMMSSISSSKQMMFAGWM